MVNLHRRSLLRGKTHIKRDQKFPSKEALQPALANFYILGQRILYTRIDFHSFLKQKFKTYPQGPVANILSYKGIFKEKKLTRYWRKSRESKWQLKESEANMRAIASAVQAYRKMCRDHKERVKFIYNCVQESIAAKQPEGSLFLLYDWIFSRCFNH